PMSKFALIENPRPVETLTSAKQRPPLFQKRTKSSRPSPLTSMGTSWMLAGSHPPTDPFQELVLGKPEPVERRTAARPPLFEYRVTRSAFPSPFTSMRKYSQASSQPPMSLLAVAVP